MSRDPFFWDVSVFLWNDGPACARMVEGRAYFAVPTGYHTFRWFSTDPLPVGPSRVSVTTEDPQQVPIKQIEITGWTPAACP